MSTLKSSLQSNLNNSQRIITNKALFIEFIAYKKCLRKTKDSQISLFKDIEHQNKRLLTFEIQLNKVKEKIHANKDKLIKNDSKNDFKETTCSFASSTVTELDNADDMEELELFFQSAIHYQSIKKHNLRVFQQFAVYTSILNLLGVLVALYSCI